MRRTQGGLHHTTDRSAYRHLRLPTENISYIHTHCSLSNTNTATQHQAVEKEGFHARKFLIGQSFTRSYVIGGQSLVCSWHTSFSTDDHPENCRHVNPLPYIKAYRISPPPAYNVGNTTKLQYLVHTIGVHTLLELTGKGSSVSTSPHPLYTCNAKKKHSRTGILCLNSRAEQKYLSVFSSACNVLKQYCSNASKYTSTVTLACNVRKQNTPTGILCSSSRAEQQHLRMLSLACKARKERYTAVL